jgi:hypothetical protein
MRLTLTKPELEEYVDSQVKAGRFATPEAVVEDALLRAMAADIELTPKDLEAIEKSRQEYARGETVNFKDFAARMRRKYGIADA